MKLKKGSLWSRHTYKGHDRKTTVIICPKCKRNYLKELADKKYKGNCYLCLTDTTQLFF